LTLYYLFPVEHRAHQSVALRLIVALALFAIILSIEVRFIANHDRPMLRAGVAMATIIPLFLVMFAWIYLTMSTSDPTAFGGSLNRTSALYFTVTVFSTCRFRRHHAEDGYGPHRCHGPDAYRPRSHRSCRSHDPWGGNSWRGPAPRIKRIAATADWLHAVPSHHFAVNRAATSPAKRRASSKWES
jgi:hypothetical protein